MKRRRGGTLDPISISKVRSASAASSMLTRRIVPVSYTHLDVYKRQTDDAAGQVTALFVENNPYRAYEKVAWCEAIPFQRGLGFAALLVFLSVLLVTPLHWLFGRFWPDAQPFLSLIHISALGNDTALKHRPRIERMRRILADFIRRLSGFFRRIRQIRGRWKSG